MRWRIHRFAVEFHDDISPFKPRFLGRAVVHNVADKHTLRLTNSKLRRQFWREFLDRNSQPASDHLPGLYQLLHHRTGEVAWHGKPDSHIAATLAKDRRVDPDQLAADVDQRASRIAWIDGRIRLDKILVLRDAHAGPSDRTYNPHGHGLGEAERIAHGEDKFPYLQLVGISPGNDRQPRRLDFYDSHVGLGIGPDQFGFELPFVGQKYLDLISLVNNVIVCDDQSVGIHNYTGSLSSLFALFWWITLEKFFTKKPPKKWVVERRTLKSFSAATAARGGDIHHSRLDQLGNLDEVPCASTRKWRLRRSGNRAHLHAGLRFRSCRPGRKPAEIGRDHQTNHDPDPYEQHRNQPRPTKHDGGLSPFTHRCHTFGLSRTTLDHH